LFLLCAELDPALRSGFRLAAQTPRKRLNFCYAEHPKYVAFFRPMKTRLILLALCCAALALATGCAAPGAPLPPSLRLPQPVENLSAVRKGNRVVLTWTPPTETTDRLPMRWPSTTRVCRVVNEFPIRQCGGPVAQIKSSELVSESPAAPRVLVSFEDVLPEALIAPESASSQNLATYALEVANERGRSAGLSNQARISLAPAIAPPASLRALLDAQGPLLRWEMAAIAPPAAGTSCITRIYRRAHGAAFELIAEQPCRTGPGEARDASFEWEQEYDYKAAAVSVIASPGRPGFQVEGDNSESVHLVVHDVFPPAVPTGLQAVFSSVGQKPFIDLTWTPNSEADLAGYLVYRSTAETDFTLVSPAQLKAPAWRDNDVQPGKTYVYAVSAVDVRGNQSARSAPAQEAAPQELR